MTRGKQCLTLKNEEQLGIPTKYLVHSEYVVSESEFQWKINTYKNTHIVRNMWRSKRTSRSTRNVHTMSCMCECECETQMDVMHVVKTLQTKCACCKIQTCIDLRTFVSFRKSTMIMQHALVSVVSECVVPTTNEHEYNELRTIQEICPHRNVCACVKSIHARML